MNTRSPRVRKTVLLAALLAAFLWFATVGIGASKAEAQGPEIDLQAELSSIRVLIDESMAAYRAGDRDESFRLARAAYLDHFEVVEIPLRIRDANFTLEMEYRFSEWRSKISDGAPVEEVEKVANELRTTQREIEILLEGTGVLAPSLVIFTSFTILFREGLEVILVVAALLAYLRTQNPAMRRPVWIGASLAIPASVLTWLILRVVLDVAPIGRELLESIVSFIAVGLLFYMSFWLLQRLDVRNWMEFLRAKTWAAVSSGSAGALTALAFFAAYREGAETAIFYQVLLWMTPRMEVYVLIGVLIAAIVLTGLGWMILKVGTKLPVKTMLTSAVAMIMLISVFMVGNAVTALQDANVIGISFVDGFPRFNPFVAQFLGLHPSLESIGAQATLAGIYLLGALHHYWWRQRGGLATRSR